MIGMKFYKEAIEPANFSPLSKAMITTDQKQAAENAASGEMVQVREAHIWPSMRDCATLGVQPKQYYHVVSGDYRAGSTVTIPTLLALGLRVEVIE